MEWKIERDPAKSLVDQIYDLIRARIVRAELRPGSFLREKEIAAELNVSRTPVREAVRRLVDEGLVSVLPQSATRVAQIEAGRIREAYLIRRSLEMTSASEAATLMTAADDATLERILIDHQTQLDASDFDAAIALDDRFHQFIADVAQLSYLWRMVTISKGQLDRCRRLLIPLAGNAETTMDHHRRIADALAARDPEQAATAIAAHLDIAYQEVEDVVASGGFDFPEERQIRQKRTR